jgi:plastocyanin
MYQSAIRVAFAIAAIVLAGSAAAKDYEISQKEKKFSQATLTVKVGDVVNFKNDDTFAHNIFSLSDIKTFDLGSYPKGQSKPVTFDKPGVVEIECAIHPDMKVVVDVKK